MFEDGKGNLNFKYLYIYIYLIHLKEKALISANNRYGKDILYAPIGNITQITLNTGSNNAELLLCRNATCKSKTS